MIISMVRPLSNINASEEFNFWTQYNQINVSTDTLKPLEQRQSWSQERIDEYNKYRIEAIPMDYCSIGLLPTNRMGVHIINTIK